MKILPSNDINSLYEKVTRSSNVVLVSHSHPDGDAAGCCVAMLSWLKSIWVKAVVVMPEKFPDTLEFLLEKEVAGDFIYCDGNKRAAKKAVKESDLIIFLDMNHPSRAGERLEEYLGNSTADKVLIDHHPDPPSDYFLLSFSDTQVSSASELLYHILLQMPGIPRAKSLPPLAAKALMTGMTTDTNNFANSVFPTTLSMASDLLDAGVDRDDILEHVFRSYGAARVELMGYLLDKCLKITPEGTAYIILRKRTAKWFGIKDGDTEGFVNIPLSIGKVKLSLFLTEEKDRFRVSIRSKRGISANSLAGEYFHGGGHEQAAGGKLMISKDVRNASQAAAYVESATRKFLTGTK